MEELIGKIPRCPGTCFFIDIIHSTRLKYSTPVSDWVKKINNTFNFISFLNDFPNNIVKGIGDEIMLYIPDCDLKSKSAYNTYFALLEEIHATLSNIRHFPKPDLFLNCRVAIHHCCDVYNISFFKGVNDYYGSDIDITARLMERSVENRIVLSEQFYRKVREDLAEVNLPADSGCLERVTRKLTAQFKGVPVQTEYRMIDVD
jgi:class 3 adenylate cyclase